MSGPTVNTTLESCLRHCLFSESIASISEQTQPLVAPLTEMRQLITEYLTEFNQADAVVIQKRAVLAYWNQQLLQLMRVIATEARAADTRNKQWRVIEILFPTKTPSQLIEHTGIGLTEDFPELRKLLAGFPSLPIVPELQRLRDLGSELEAQLVRLEELITNVTTVVAIRTSTKNRQSVILHAVLRAFDQFKGQLMMLYPGQKALVKSFFLPVNEERSAKSTGKKQAKE